MSRINRLDIKLYKEVELDSEFNEIGKEKISAYMMADNGMTAWICSGKNKQEILEFLNPEIIVEELECVLAEEEIDSFLDALRRLPYCLGDKEFRAVFN